MNLVFSDHLLAAAQDTGTIQAVSSSDFSNRIISVIQVIYNALDPIVVPAAKLGLLISALVLIFGGIFMSKNVKKVGWYGIATTIGVLFFFYLAPLILGFIVTATKAGK